MGINYTPLQKVGVTMKMMPEGAFKHPKAGRPEGREQKLQTISHRRHPTQRHKLACREFKNFLNGLLTLETRQCFLKVWISSFS